MWRRRRQIPSRTASPVHRRNASPPRFLLRSSKLLQSAFPLPQKEPQALSVPPALETRNSVLKNTELEHESKSKELSVLKKTGFEHESRSKELSVLKKDCFEHRGKLKS